VAKLTKAKKIAHLVCHSTAVATKAGDVLLPKLSEPFNPKVRSFFKRQELLEGIATPALVATAAPLFSAYTNVIQSSIHLQRAVQFLVSD